MSCHHGNPNQRHLSCFPSASPKPPKPERATPPTVHNSLMILHYSFQRWLGLEGLLRTPDLRFPHTWFLLLHTSPSLPPLHRWKERNISCFDFWNPTNHLKFYHDLIHVYKLHFFFYSCNRNVNFHILFFKTCLSSACYIAHNNFCINKDILSCGYNLI